MRDHDPSTLYRPITATPFTRSAAHMELPPCPALQPYIRCFWGTTEPIPAGKTNSGSPSLVIPDTCMDIIFTLDHTRNTLDAHFCAMDERAHTPHASGAAVTSTFAIRFYAWTAVLFAERPLSGSKNRTFSAQEFFPSLEKELRPMLMSIDSLPERAAAAERVLLRHIRPDHMNATLMNAIHDVIRTCGTIPVTELAARQALSGRQLERVFNEHIGVSPKSFASLVRYQMLWQELCFSRRCDMLDLVGKYGYFDQAHLLNDFRRRHTMTPAQALRLAKG